MSQEVAKTYLNRFDTKTLYNFLLQQIVYARPEDPKDFLAGILQQIQSGQTVFYTEQEIELVFKKFEVL